ncbi:BTB domain-containing protein [Trichonephila inaurata madagascariensis]|uniref:BTB domain-containing protein n=1 Tax=Trichonephila inaurata madagascariensis TaxID=2747483 RepID=A0A8X6YKU4_9ARAC|nr:BTB domain-containing protein [Trichonephila inaurata madagascariensis]
MDGVNFAIPFEDGKEAFGSKLVSCSPVFKIMLKHPMKEKLHKMVKLDDIYCHTFINFLIYLKSNCLLTESFSEITDLYEMADKYDIKDLMRTCVERIVPFFTSDNIKDIEVLAFLHNDDFLLQLVDSFKNKKLIPQSSSLSEANLEALTKQYVESINFEEMVKPAHENTFDFYQ